MITYESFLKPVKMYLIEKGLCGLDWFHLAQDRYQWWALVNTVMNLQVL
jgi:hypothetical protein